MLKTLFAFLVFLVKLNLDVVLDLVFGNISNLLKKYILRQP